MQTTPNHPGCVLEIAAAMLPLVAFAASARADIFQWEYINPADASQGKQQSTTLAPDGAGVDAVPGATLGGRNLTMAYLISADVRNASFYGATLTNADVTDARIEGARFDRVLMPFCFFGGACYLEGGISVDQLYSTASYGTRDLSGVSLRLNDVSDGNFAGQRLINADFSLANLANADFTGAEVQGARFDSRYLGFYRFYGATEIALAQLYSTASYQAHDLSGIDLSANSLLGADFTGQNLVHARFDSADLRGADFTGAKVREASFSIFYYDDFYGPRGTGITLAQLYSTASFQSHDLSGIGLNGDNLAGGDFTDQNLTNASFILATLANADFSAADTRGAILTNAYLDGSITANMIQPDGHIDGLDLDAGHLLAVRDHDGNPKDLYGNALTVPPIPIPIAIDEQFAMAPGGTLRMVFEADDWGSTISFAPGIPVTLGGTLELTFTDDVNLASQVGRTFDLFNWTSVNPTGAFAIVSPYAWDLSNLYTTGEVTLIAIPEPCALWLFGFAMTALVAMGRARLRLY